MAKNAVTDWDETAANNSDIGGIGILGTDFISAGDNAMREFMAQVAAGMSSGNIMGSGYLAKSGAYTVLEADRGKTIDCTAELTLTLTAAATLGAGWILFVKANGGKVTIDPNGSETVDGSTTFIVPDGTSAAVICDGSNFHTTIQSALSAPAGHIFGLTLSNGTDADHDIDIAIGSAASDDTTPVNMSLTTAITKQLDATWAVGTNAGGLDAGSIAADTWYYPWLIERSDTGVVDALFSTSATSPTMPTNYDRKRRLPGGVVTDSSSNITPFLMRGRYIEYNTTPALGFNSSSLGATADTSGAFLVPGAFKVKAHFNCAGNSSSGVVAVLVSDPDIVDIAPNPSATPLGTIALNSTVTSATQGHVMTGTTGTIRLRSSAASTTFRMVVYAWEDILA